jgi:hypothetical protein
VKRVIANGKVFALADLIATRCAFPAGLISCPGSCTFVSHA